jgi:hypothetical protein
MPAHLCASAGDTVCGLPVLACLYLYATFFATFAFVCELQGIFSMPLAAGICFMDETVSAPVILERERLNVFLSIPPVDTLTKPGGRTYCWFQTTRVVLPESTLRGRPAATDVAVPGVPCLFKALPLRTYCGWLPVQPVASVLFSPLFHLPRVGSLWTYEEL